MLGVWLAALLTLLVWTYLVRDTFLFRIASALLVGTAIGLTSAIVLRRVLWDGLLVPLYADAGNLFVNQWPLLIPLALGVSLLLKLTPSFRSTTVSNLGLAYLFGLGVALAVGGALSGLLVPQLLATVISLAPRAGTLTDAYLGTLNAILIVVGTLGAFLTFRFIQPGPRPWQRVYAAVTTGWGTLGRGFIMIAFGAILASLVTARVSTLVGQLYFLLHDWLAVLQ